MKEAMFRAKGSDTTEILLYDEIGRSFWSDGIDAKQFREQLKAVKTPTISLRINSPGGSVIEAAAMMSALDEHPARIEVTVDGMAASAASSIMMTGDVIRVAQDALVMIHNPSAVAMGGAEDMRRMAELLDKIQGQMIDRYLAKAKAKTTREQMIAYVNAETWFTAKEAVDAGLADEAIGASNVAAFAEADFARFGYRNLPKAALAAQARATDEAARKEHEKRREVAARLTAKA